MSPTPKTCQGRVYIGLNSTKPCTKPLGHSNTSGLCRSCAAIASSKPRALHQHFNINSRLEPRKPT